MIELLRGFRQHVQEHGKKTLFYDREGKREISYREADEMSDRVAGYLAARGIGREDPVAVMMPRCSEFVIAELGILKAGAAFVPIDAHIPQQRRDYIIQNAGCRIVLDEETFAETQRAARIDKWADSDEHDLAFIVYTSGSTGAPKGIMQEYGVIDWFLTGVADLIGEKITGDYFKVHSAVVTPFMFTATIFLRLALVYYGAPTHVISEEMLQNGPKLIKYFIFKRIQLTFMTPSLIKTLEKIPGLALKFVILGGEVVHECYSKKYNLVNGYAMGEAGTIVSYFFIDQKYDVTPVGRPCSYMNTMLIDEETKERTEGEGILCLELPYFRGYLGLEETTKKSMIEKDGRTWFVTGDVAEQDKQGILTIRGRSGDMVKINGNRVEIGEVEAAMMRCFPKLTKVAVKAFTDKNSQSQYLCAFYESKKEIRAEEFTEKLSREITSYMMPRYYVRVDEFAKTSTGKIDKKALASPLATELRGEYVAPVTPLQEKICKAFESAMDIDQIGIRDDIVEMGADSLAVMSALAELELPGMELSDFVAARTPEKMAALAETKKLSAGEYTPEKLETELSREHQLTDLQLFFMDYQLYTPLSTMYNLCSMFRFDASMVDAGKLAEAVGASIQHHKGLLTKIYISEGGDFRQCYEPSFFTPVTVEDVTEEELDQLRPELVKPFVLIGHPLYRARIFRSEKYVHLFFDVHHMLFDGTSYHVFMKDIFMAYMGQKMMTDYWFVHLAAVEQYKGSEREKDDQAYYKSLYPAEVTQWNTRPAYDFESRDNRIGEIFEKLAIDNEKLAAVSEQFKMGSSGMLHSGMFIHKSDRVVLDDSICLLYQSNLYEAGDAVGIPVEEEEVGGYDAAENALDYEFLEKEDGLHLISYYNACLYKEESIRRFGKMFTYLLNEICRTQDGTVDELLARMPEM